MIYHVVSRKKAIISIFCICAVAVIVSCVLNVCLPAFAPQPVKKDYIKYVEFNVPYTALQKALDYDIESHQNEEQVPLNWIEILSYLAAKYGGNFERYKSSDMEKLVNQLNEGESINDLTKDMKYYAYYHEAYSAILDGMVGYFRIQIANPDNPEEFVWQEKYGLCAFSPIAKTYPFEHYDDFGAKRTYGYSRPHLGHDLMAATGTPVIAVESGVVEAIGWNQYGGWRIGIRSFDKKRYYYYAHLRKNRPYAAGLKEGDIVTAGDVIGYVGRTGYSTTENVNNIEISHLHLGLQLIFDESQKESNNEIWINLYPLTMLLKNNQSEVYREASTKEYYRKYQMELIN